jgi:diguanylate cyclase (GGDEF)-like protein
MTTIPRRSPVWIMGSGAVVVFLVAAWAFVLEPARTAIVITLAVAAAAALALAYRDSRRATRTIGDYRCRLADSASLRLQIIEALSFAIDARHRSAHSIRREQTYAAALARAFGLNDDEAEGILTAALLHDVGKLAVPDHILTKPGPLSPDEQRKVRIHPQVGAGIISGVSFPYPVASLVLCHHERWDGTGYPSGLRGSDIPLGARILACVDHYEALTSDRSFHHAMPAAGALDVLWSEAGKALDPVVVARFAELLPSLQAAETAVHAPGSGPAAGSVDGEVAPDSGPEGSATGVAALRDIALANNEIRNLYEMSRAIGRTLGVSDSMSVIATRLQHLVPFEACALFLHDQEEGAARCRFATGHAAERIRKLSLRAGSGSVGQVITNRRVLISPNAAAELTSAAPDIEPWPFESLLACPLVVAEAVVGVLVLYHSGGGAYTEEHGRLVQVVAEQAAAVIQNSVVFEQTQVDSVTDALTGLPNIRLLFVHLGRELARASRLGTPVSLLLLDIDNLKEINDTYGHVTGDHAICKVASALVAAIRPYDLCVRYGGDEFIVVLSGCRREEADAKLAELRQAVESNVFEVQGRRRVRLSISGGAAVFPEDGRTYDPLLALADRRMYNDKASRRLLRGILAENTNAGVSDADIERAALGVL